MNKTQLDMMLAAADIKLMPATKLIYVESTSGGSVATREILFGFRLNYGGQEQEMYDQQMASAQAIAVAA